MRACLTGGILASDACVYSLLWIVQLPVIVCPACLALMSSLLMCLCGISLLGQELSCWEAALLHQWIPHRPVGRTLRRSPAGCDAKNYVHMSVSVLRGLGGSVLGLRTIFLIVRQFACTHPFLACLCSHVKKHCTLNCTNTQASLELRHL